MTFVWYYQSCIHLRYLRIFMFPGIGSYEMWMMDVDGPVFMTFFFTLAEFVKHNSLGYNVLTHNINSLDPQPYSNRGQKCASSN